MCCLFGMIDYRGHFTGRQKTRLLSVLAAECEARGTDAAGVGLLCGRSPPGLQASSPCPRAGIPYPGRRFGGPGAHPHDDPGEPGEELQ